MTWPRLVFLLALVATLVAPVRATAQLAPEPGDSLRVYLVTIGQGDLVWEKFGHNGIWIHDPVRGTDLVYNYGVFDFDSPGYWGRFVRGTWIYQIAANTMEETVFAYQYYDRSLLAQELNLLPEEKRELQEFLEWNLRPENREYRYDYFLDNCSTRVRDAIDRVLGGRLRAATEGRPTETTYRWHSRRLIADDRISYAGMNAGLGPATDEPIDEWEEMFLPEKVAERVREIQVAGPDGALRPLVASERVIYASTRGPERAAAPRWIPYFLLAGVAVAALLLLLARWSRAGFAVAAALWALIVGLGGLALAGLWAFTDHLAAHRNENLLHFDPLAIGLVVLVPAAAYGARWARRPALLLSLAVAALSLLGFALQALPGLDQVNGEAIALTLPGNLALAWWAWKQQVTGNR